MILIAEELGGSLARLPDYEAYFATGDTGELRLYLVSPMSQEDILQMEQEILSQGVVLTAPIVQDANILVIKFRKVSTPLIIMVSVIGVVLQGWQLFKMDGGIPLWALVAGVAILGYFMWRPSSTNVR